MNAIKSPGGNRGGEQEQRNLPNCSTKKIEFNENPLPGNKVAEIGVLSACVADSMKLDPVRAIVGPDDFYMGGVKAVFTKMLELHSKDSGLTGSPFLVRIETSFEHHQDYQKFQDLFDSLRPITGTTATHFARIVHETASRRRIIALTYEANLKAFDPAFDLNDIIEELLEPLSRLEGGCL
ncbi:MAG: hypothetical protein IID17_14930 [Nitrospinae bacterium]|nr:hypothetical protein [Nitrospinota bacterium]